MKKFSIATFNLFNLNEPGLPMYKDTQGWSREQYDRKIAWTGRQINLLNADVMAFQELWHADSLTRAFSESSMADGYQLLTPADATGKKSFARLPCAERFLWSRWSGSRTSRRT